MSNTPKTHNNAPVRAFLGSYYSASELCGEHPPIDDIFSGVLELKSAGDSSTRSLSRQVLFHILQRCRSLNVASIHEGTNENYAYRTAARYAEVARVASKAIEGYIQRLHSPAPRLTIAQERALIDAPYADELAHAETWNPESNRGPTGSNSEAPLSGLALLRNPALARLVEHPAIFAT